MKISETKARYEARLTQRHADLEDLASKLGVDEHRALVVRMAIRSPSLVFDIMDATEIADNGRPGAIPTPESESNDDSDSDSGVGIGVGIICSSFWWSRNRGDWNRNRSRNRGDWNRSWNRNQMTIPYIYVHEPSNIHSGSNPQET